MFMSLLDPPSLIFCFEFLLKEHHDCIINILAGRMMIRTNVSSKWQMHGAKLRRQCKIIIGINLVIIRQGRSIQLRGCMNSLFSGIGQEERMWQIQVSHERRFIELPLIDLIANTIHYKCKYFAHSLTQGQQYQNQTKQFDIVISDLSRSRQMQKVTMRKSFIKRPIATVEECRMLPDIFLIVTTKYPCWHM